MSYGFQLGLISSVTYFYSEGIYEKTRTPAHQHEMFTIGRWETVAIPGFEGTYAPHKRRFYLVSVGFEGSKTQRAINRADPERIAVLFPKPGIVPEYEKTAGERNAALFEQYGLSNEKLICAPAADAIEAWRAIAHEYPEN